MVDVLVDVQRGDCGKGKVSKRLLEIHHYNAVAKYNGSGNAGHAIWIGDKKYTTHYLTSAIYNENSHVLIGPGAILNPEAFFTEYDSFYSLFDLKDRVFIHPFVNIITDKHIIADDPDGKIGSTRKGTGPCYADKYARKNKRAIDIPELHPFLLHNHAGIESTYPSILMEGSQGWWLDIDWGQYPFVTSSHIHPGFAFATFGIPLKQLSTVYGVCKIYETYVGSNENMVVCSPEDANTIREAGKEYGETTGRPRKVGYLDIENLITAINLTGVNTLIINKCDVLKDVGIFKMYFGNTAQVGHFKDIHSMIYSVHNLLRNRCPGLGDIHYSFDREGKDLIL